MNQPDILSNGYKNDTGRTIIYLICCSFAIYCFFVIFVFKNYSYYGTEYAYVEGLRWICVFFMSFLIVITTVAADSIAGILVCVFMFQLAAAYYMQDSIVDNTGDLFGLYMGDGFTYYDYATSSNLLSFRDLEMTYSSIHLDDLGMFIVLRIIRFLSFNIINNMPFVFLFFGSIATVTSSFFFYKTALFFLTERNSQIATIVYGESLYWAFCSAQFLKENFLMLFITMSIYYLFKNIKSKKGFSFLFIISALLTGLFRAIYPVFFLLSAFSFYLRRFFSKKYFVLFSIVELLFVSLFLSFFINQFSSALDLNLSYEHMLYVGEARASFLQSRFLSGFIVFISSIFGPFCSFFSKTQPVLVLYGFYFLFKGFLSYFFISGIYKLYNTNHVFFPIVDTYLFLSLLMMVMLSVGMDFRFQAPYFPIFLIICFYGLEKTDKKNLNSIVCFLGYAVFLCILTMLYNRR